MSLRAKTFPELREDLRLRTNLCAEYRNSYLEIISLFGPTVLTIVMNHHHTRDARLTLEANGAIAARATGGDSGGNNVYVTLKTQLELQTILCTEYRNSYFAIINLIGDGIFSFVGDHHQQHDGVREAGAARVDDMIERIWRAAD